MADPGTATATARPFLQGAAGPRTTSGGGSLGGRMPAWGFHRRALPDRTAVSTAIRERAAMKGLYLNLPSAVVEAASVQAALEAPHALSRFSHPALGSGAVVHFPGESVLWADDQGRLAVRSGWFLFRGRWNDLPALGEALAGAPTAEGRRGVLGEIEAGAFVLVWADAHGAELVTDAFGLHPHYAPRGKPLEAVAPTPRAVAAGAPRDPVLAGLLESVNHLFGDLTAWDAVVRLRPGRVHTSEGAVEWFDHVPAAPAPEQMLAEMREGLRPLPEPRLLAVSGGLDSRLLLAAIDRVAAGYTFGPKDTGDRPVARRLAHRVDDYSDFSLLDVAYPERLREAGRWMFDGTCRRPFLEVLAVHRHVHRRWPDSRVFLDGYGGDVLQRGLYLTHGGLRGAAAKVLPRLTLRRFDPLDFLMLKYPALKGPARARVAETFEETTAGWRLDGPHRLVLFEILHGRGARYVINGGTTMAGQYFPTVQPFYLHRIFRGLFGLPAERWVRYQAIRDVWAPVPPDLAAVRTYSGFRPTWNGDVARLTMLATKGLARAGLWSRARGYEAELSDVVWR